MQPKRLTRGLLCATLFIISCSRLFSQLPAVIPGSPETFNLCQAGLLSNNLYTGTASLSIPLYDVALKNYTLNVRLQYASNGIHSSDMPSYVGMGFNLVAGGVITRIIRDEPDGVPENEPYSSFPNPSQLSSNLRWYLNEAADNYWDTEPDEYMYNFNGMAGRFFVDSSGIGHCIPENNLKIQVADTYGSKEFTITTADGTVYVFDLTETTNTFQVYGSHTYSTSFSNETAWFLTSITTQTGEWIKFYYGSSQVIDSRGIYSISYTPTYQNNCGGNQCPTGSQSGSNQLNHDTRYLTGISASNGINILLVYEQRPDFNDTYNPSHDYRIQYISVRENLTGTLNTIKKYNFKYGVGMRDGVPIHIYRYFLDTLESESIDASGLKEKYVFEYYNRGHLGYRDDGWEWDVFGYQGQVAYWYPGWNNYPVDWSKIDTAATRQYYESLGLWDDDKYPNPTVGPIGMLTKVTYPTGGWQKFHYEPNIISGGIIAGGTRVKSVENYDPLSGISNKKHYKYTSIADTTASSGISSFQPFYSSNYNYGFVCGQVIQECPSTLVSSNSLTPYSSSKGSFVTYSSVIESDDGNLAHGGIEHTFFNDYVPLNYNLYLGDVFVPVPNNLETDMNGSEIQTVIFKKNGNSFVTLKKVANTYQADFRNQKILNGYITRRRYRWPEEWSPPQSYEFNGFDVIGYQYKSFKFNLTKTVTTTYDEKGQNPLLDSILFEYADNVAWLPTKITRKASDTATLVTYNIFPNQINNGIDVHYQMRVNRNMPGVLVESKTYREGNLVATQKTVFNDNFGGNIVLPQQLQTKLVPDSSNYKTRMQVYAYGTGGTPKEVSKENDIHYSYVYDYPVDSTAQDNLPIAEVMNASISNVAYTSFEAGGKGGWSFSGTPQVNPASITGSRCYILSSGNITKSVSSGIAYIVTFWLKNTSGTATVNGNAGTQLVNKNGWTLYRSAVSGASTVTVAGTGKIDELRLYPQGAQMRTMTYRQHIGLSSECDINNRIIYYDYDAFGRLMLVRDEDKKIIKKNCYTYNGQTENCSVYGNGQKVGNFTRNNCGSGYITTPVTYTVPANTYYATTQAAADALAETDVNVNGQDDVNANGVCTVGWYNEERSGQFTKTNCGEGYVGVTGTYTVPAGTYTSTSSQAYANQLAQDDVNNNGQNWVDSNDFCLPIPSISYYDLRSWQSPLYFTFINVNTNQQYDFDTGTDPYILGYLPVGYYDVYIYDPLDSGYHYYDIGCSDYAYGEYYAFASYVYLDWTCNTIYIDLH